MMLVLLYESLYFCSNIVITFVLLCRLNLCSFYKDRASSPMSAIGRAE